MRWILIIGWISVLGFIVLNLLFSFFRRSFPRPVIEKGADMVFDEVCRVYIPKERARHLKLKGKNHYFCSQACEESFLTQAGGKG
ncbi:MAG: hypothetical protein ACYDBV_10485 [Nitrospiria bacterium]